MPRYLVNLLAWVSKYWIIGIAFSLGVLELIICLIVDSSNNYYIFAISCNLGSQERDEE